jgi:hypothetical protein
MKNIQKYISFKFLFCLFCAVFGASQTAIAQDFVTKNADASAPVANRKATKAQWEAAKSGIDYTGLKKEKPAADSPKLDFRPPSVGFLAGLGKAGQFFLIAFIIALVAGLLYFLIGQGLFLQNKAVAAQKTDFNIADIENNLHETDLERFLRQALANTDYRAAIRLYYLSILKAYSLSEIIAWKKDKTNNEYLTEVRRSESPTYRDFREATLTFERVWYGEMRIEAVDYTKIQTNFERLLASITSKNTAK